MKAVSRTRGTALRNPTHIYIVGFDDGIVKVGRTSAPHKRMITLASTARKTGATITRKLILPHDDAKRAEWYLCLVGGGFFKRAHGTEYFYADFDAFVQKVRDKFDDYGFVFEAPESERVA